MSIFNLFGPQEHPEEKWLKVLRDYLEDAPEFKAIYNARQVDFYGKWIKSTHWKEDPDIAAKAYEYTMPKFLEKVRSGAYQAGNWLGYCYEIAEKNYLKRRDREKTTAPLTDQIPMPLEEESLADWIDMKPYFQAVATPEDPFPLMRIWEARMNDTEWETLAATLTNEGHRNANSVNLRQFWSRKTGQVPHQILRESWRDLVAEGLFCHPQCQTFVRERLNGTRTDVLKRDQPELAEWISKKWQQPNFAKAAEQQMEKCTDCLLKKYL